MIYFVSIQIVFIFTFVCVVKWVILGILGLHKSIYILYIYIFVMFIVIWWHPFFIPFRNLDDVFTYNHMALMSLRNRSHIKESVV